MPIFSPSIGWMHVRLLLLLERYLHRERERKKINPNPLQLEEMRTKDEKRRGIRKEAKKQLIMYAVTTHFFFLSSTTSYRYASVHIIFPCVFLC